MKTIASLIACCVCLTWARAALDPAAPAAWIDHSPHREAFVTVNNVRLQYLDWGGKGEPLVFLAGLGDGAHIFDDLAPDLTNRFRVVALTRRGSGKSGKPGAGYELDTMVEDIRQFLDALKFERATLAGHSFGGVEAARFAEKFPERVIQLVLFEACYDFTLPGSEVLSRVGPFEPAPGPEDRAGFPALLRWFQKNRPGWNDACESNFRDTRRVTASGYSSESSMPDPVAREIFRQAFAFKPDYAKITAPALAFFADHRLEKLLQTDGPDRERNKELLDEARKWQRMQIEQFTRLVRNGRVRELPDTDHFCFIQRHKEVVREMQSFLK